MKKQVFFYLILLNSLSVFGQRYKILSGDFKNLKNIKEYYCTFDYKDMKVNLFNSETDFLKAEMESRKRYDNGKDLKGKAVAYEKQWYENRKEKHEPGFINYFNKKLEEYGIKAGLNLEAKYTLNIKTNWIYTGFDLGAIHPATITAIITIFETANPSNVLFAVEFDKSIGIVNEYSSEGDLIKGAYERLAKNLTLQMKRFL